MEHHKQTNKKKYLVDNNQFCQLAATAKSQPCTSSNNDGDDEKEEKEEVEDNEKFYVWLKSSQTQRSHCFVYSQIQEQYRT
ncbi:hypothetical protein BLOT_014634 [Blomia tropicalis]|nr:hypothetical protein BLOT_014634 [Blomia tropicalis]